MTTIINANVLADSVSVYGGERLTTLEVTFPRIILSEFNTHRVFSRNSASSRAIPSAKQLKRVRDDPFIPTAFPINRPGMSATEYVLPEDHAYKDLRWVWLAARDDALNCVSMLTAPGRNVHKQIANRLLEPFMWHTVIVSSTEWDNFFDLRISEFAQPEIRVTAEAMRDAMAKSTPIPKQGRGLNVDDWHLPLLGEEDDDLSLMTKIKCSVARCAAVSYERHKERNIDKEMDRYALLASNKHLSPFEHVAIPCTDISTRANFKGWRQVRWYIEHNVGII